MLQNLHQQIPPHCRMLVDEYALALERGTMEKIGEAFDIRRARCAVLCRKLLMAGLKHAPFIK